MFMLNSQISEVALSDELRLSSVIRAFVEFFFTPAEVEQYAPWIDLMTILGTLFLVALFLRLLFSPLFPRRSKR